MSATLAQTLAIEAQAAFDRADFETALLKAGQLQVILAASPNLARNLAGGGSQSISWGGAGSLPAFISLCRQLKTQQLIAAHGPWQATKIVYQRPTTAENL